MFDLLKIGRDNTLVRLLIEPGERHTFMSMQRRDILSALVANRVKHLHLAMSLV